MKCFLAPLVKETFLNLYSHSPFSVHLSALAEKRITKTTAFVKGALALHFDKPACVSNSHTTISKMEKIDLELSDSAKKTAVEKALAGFHISDQDADKITKVLHCAYFFLA